MPPQQRMRSFSPPPVRDMSPLPSRPIMGVADGAGPMPGAQASWLTSRMRGASPERRAAAPAWEAEGMPGGFFGFTAGGASGPSAARERGRGGPPEPSPSQLEREPLNRHRQAKENLECADCGQKTPEWAALNHGTMICIECAAVHLRLGSPVKCVKTIHRGNPAIL